MSENENIDQKKLKIILKYAFDETKNFKTVNSTAVQKIIKKMKEELKDNEN